MPEKTSGGKNKTMRASVLFLGIFGIMSSVCRSQQTIPITEFYPIADSITNFPPIDRKLAVICEKKIDRWNVSFVGSKSDSKVMIAVVTSKPFSAPESLALTVAFDGYRPSTGKYP